MGIVLWNIGKETKNATAQHIVAWEWAHQMAKANSSASLAKEATARDAYDACRDKSNLVFQKIMMDDGDKAASKQVEAYYLDNESEWKTNDNERIRLESVSVERFLGVFSLSRMGKDQQLTCAIVIVPGERVLCITAFNQAQPQAETYIFDAAAGTLERSECLFTSIERYVGQGKSSLRACIVVSPAPAEVTVIKSEPASPQPKPKKREREQPSNDKDAEGSSSSAQEEEEEEQESGDKKRTDAVETPKKRTKPTTTAPRRKRLNDPTTTTKKKASAKKPKKAAAAAPSSDKAAE